MLTGADDRDIRSCKKERSTSECKEWTTEEFLTNVLTLLTVSEWKKAKGVEEGRITTIKAV